MGEDLEGLAELELAVHFGGGVSLDAEDCELFLGWGEELGVGGGAGEVEEGEDGEGDGAEAFD